MKDTVSLDDLLLFVAVADAGGLAGASRSTGVSVPTLSRRMSELESRLSLRLFSRGAKGYALTASGRALLQEAEELRSVSLKLKAFASKTSTPRVRITAGQWTSQFLAQNIHQFWQSDSDWRPVFCASNLVVDIARREADIGIRNHRPEQSWLAGRRTAIVDYAVFAKSMDISGFVALSEQQAGSASERWVRTHHGEDIVISASHPRLAVDLALQEVGQIVLPIFAAASFPALKRVGEPIEDLRHEEWIVCHHDARKDPPIRKALDAITKVLTDRSLRNGSQSDVEKDGSC